MTEAMRKAPVLCVGRLYCDLIFSDLPRMPTLGTEVFSENFGAHAGGGAFITAAHLSQLGHGASLAAMLPASPFTDLMRPDLEAARLDLSLCASLSASDGPQLTVAMAKDDDRSFLTRRAGPAFPDLTADALRKLKIKHLHIGEIASLVAHPGVIEIARSVGATISVDCGWEDDFDLGALRPLVRCVDVFLPNETEMEALLALGIEASVAPLTVVKMGSQGAMAVTADQTVSAPAQKTDVVDTTGAGDAFNAGFLSAWLSGASLQKCLEAGNMRGALAVKSVGGFSPALKKAPNVGVPGE